MKVAYEARLDMSIDRVLALSAEEEAVYRDLDPMGQLEWLEALVKEDAAREAEAGGDSVEVESIAWRVVDGD